jgi:hypothetical protein
METQALPKTTISDSSPAARVFALLEGSWTIERAIEPGGQYVGIAEFIQVSPDILEYYEKGRLSLANGKRLDAEKRYTYLLQDGTIEVRFADGMNDGQHFVFIEFPTFQEQPWPIESAEDTHICRLDTYKAVFRFESPDSFSTTYNVCGPRKGYVSRSVYTRDV